MSVHNENLLLLRILGCQILQTPSQLVLAVVQYIHLSQLCANKSDILLYIKFHTCQHISVTVNTNFQYNARLRPNARRSSVA